MPEDQLYLFAKRLRVWPVQHFAGGQESRLSAEADSARNGEYYNCVKF